MSGAEVEKKRDSASEISGPAHAHSHSSVIDLRPPSLTRLGRYRVVREIASGGMASVNLAVVDGLDKLVALKVIHPHLAREENFVGMFLDEARIASSISHRNVCSVFDFGECDGHYYLAMDYLAGESFRDLLVRVRQSVLDVPPLTRWVHTAYVIAEACEGLHAAHELRGPDEQSLEVVHRDVSPHNLFITYDGNVLVVDFGIARAANRIQHTATGVLKGKFSYMAPEQVRQQMVDRRADVWALGVCLWESLTLRRLFLRGSQADTLMSVLVDPIQSPRDLCPELPEELAAIAMRALSRDVDQRYPTARALGQALMGFCRNSGVATGAVEIEQWMARLFAEEKTHKRRLVRSALNAASLEHSFVDGMLASAPRTPTHSGAMPKGLLQAPAADVSLVSQDLSWQAQAASGAPLGAGSQQRPWTLWLGAALGFCGVLALAFAMKGRDVAPPVPAPASEPPGTVVQSEAANLQAAPKPAASSVAPPAPEVSAEPREAAPRPQRPAPQLRVARTPMRLRPRSEPAHDPAPKEDSAREVSEPEPVTSSTSAEPGPSAVPQPAKPPQEVVASPALATPTPAARVSSEGASQASESKVEQRPLRAEPEISDLTVEGSLGTGVVSRMLSRAIPLLRNCYSQAAQRSGRNDFSPLPISFSVDEAGAARNVRASAHSLSGFSSCAADAFRRLRSDIKPDVGTVRVRFNLTLRTP